MNSIAKKSPQLTALPLILACGLAVALLLTGTTTASHGSTATQESTGDSKTISHDQPQEDWAKKLQLVKALEKQRIGTINKVKPAVVAVFGLDQKGGGSGVIIHPSGLALTNHHVVQGAGSSGWGGLADGKLYRWNLVGDDPGGDLALIQLHRDTPFPFVEMGDSNKVKVGDWTLVMGNPFLLAQDYNPTVTFGIVSGVRRFQEGMSKRMLVYGNCLQVDSSINPGNSGGPLFDIQGRLIGINGRASFDFSKRGRVNVGIGYAISINQCRNFLPHLMATKLVQHGSLDAIFDDRDGKVVCSAIYEDAPIANLGLEIGDELLEFEGEKIGSANHFTNLICTLPANWPASLVFKKVSDQSVHSVRTRLLGLPYPKAQAPPKRPKVPSQPGKQGKGGKDEKGNKKKAAKPKELSKRAKAIQASKKGLFAFLSAEAGTTQTPKVNAASAQMVLDFWRRSSPPNAKNDSVAWKITESITEGGNSVGTMTTVLNRQGQFRLDISVDDQHNVWVFDGTKFFHSSAPNKNEKTNPLKEVKPSKLSASPYAYSLLILASQGSVSSLKCLGVASLDGAGPAKDEVAFRLRWSHDEEPFYAWFALKDFAHPKSCRLIKTAFDIDGDEGLGGIGYGDWKNTPFGVWPNHRRILNGIYEQEIQAITTEKMEAFDAPTDFFSGK